MPLCGHGGYCTRVRGHAGAHTAAPFPATHAWDQRRHTDRVIRHLDFPTPPWADLLDGDA